MLNGKKVVVILPAYNAERTLERTWREIPFGVVDGVLLVDDSSHDATAEVARRLGITTIVHTANRGYGGAQKTCYRAALDAGADVVVMLHPDYQYTPRLIAALAAMVAFGAFDAALGSRMLGKGALQGGMPRYKYLANRLLTFAENLLLGQRLSEYHTGFRAFSRQVLEHLPLHENSEDFLFDNQVLVQLVWGGYALGELSCPTRYFPEASSIGLRRSVVYGLGVLGTALAYRLARLGLVRPRFLAFAPRPASAP
jgi:glycosyltransferase involved in cell wall biosynthesis